MELHIKKISVKKKSAINWQQIVELLKMKTPANITNNTIILHISMREKSYELSLSFKLLLKVNNNIFQLKHITLLWINIWIGRLTVYWFLAQTHCKIL